MQDESERRGGQRGNITVNMWGPNKNIIVVYMLSYDLGYLLNIVSEIYS